MLAEALRNIGKHADPSRVDVVVGRDADTFTLEVRNDGVRHGARGTGMGLRLAAFEALQHGGVVEFGAYEADGWRVRLVVPLHEAASVMASGERLTAASGTRLEKLGDCECSSSMTTMSCNGAFASCSESSRGSSVASRRGRATRRSS